ncbi:MAG: hypothetical protein QM755_21060 [Luteolibacter sp.]
MVIALFVEIGTLEFSVLDRDRVAIGAGLRCSQHQAWNEDE